jgi:alcohol dehydrogenase
MTMKAAIYRKFGGRIRIEEVPFPETPNDGVVVEVKATGVCRSDFHGWKGHDSDIRDHGLPFCPGHELSGIVVRIGPDVKKFQVGDRVAVPFILSCGCCYYCCDANRPTVCTHQEQPGFTQWGSFAEYVALPRADRNLHHIPPSVSFIQAAALGCRFTTAYRAILQQGSLPHQTNKPVTVAVFGVGGLGLSCIMLAASTGKAHKIIAVDVSSLALTKAKEFGATHTVLNEKDDKAVRQKVLDFTDGHGADLTVDAGGFASTCENAIHSTKRGGKMIQVGLPIGDPTPHVDMGLVAGRELELIGSHGFSGEDLPHLLEMVANGTLDPSKLVTKVVDLAEGAREIELMDQGSPLGITMVIPKMNKKNDIGSRL